MYINGSGRDYYEFYIQLNRCGTLGKNAISEKSRENPTVSFSNSSTIKSTKFQCKIIYSNCFFPNLKTYKSFDLFNEKCIIFASWFFKMFVEFHVEHNNCAI